MSPDPSRPIAAGDDGRPGAQHVREDLPEAGSDESYQAQNEGGAQELLSQLHGDGMFDHSIRSSCAIHLI